MSKLCKKHVWVINSFTAKFWLKKLETRNTTNAIATVSFMQQLFSFTGCCERFQNSKSYANANAGNHPPCTSVKSPTEDFLAPDLYFVTFTFRTLQR